MSVAEIPAYRAAFEAVAADAPFPVFWGFECEWYPAYESWYRDYLRAEMGAEFLVFGSHWVNDNGEFWYIPEYPGWKTFRRYVDLTVQGIASGLYDFIAHPDIFLASFSLSVPDVRAASLEIIDAAIGMGMPLEINGLGLSKPKRVVEGEADARWIYPVREFWELAVDRGATIVCNSDAHRPQDVLAGTRDALAFAEALGIRAVDTVDALSFSRASLSGSGSPAQAR